MGLFDKQTKKLDEQIAALEGEIAALTAERKAKSKELDLVKDVVSLKTQIQDLKIEKGKLQEDNDREKREVMHMVGLERKRQEFEAEQSRKGIETAKRDAVLGVREENLKAEREAFVKEMKFREERFTKEVSYLKDLMGQILERLPTVTVDRQISESTKKTA